MGLFYSALLKLLLLLLLLKALPGMPQVTDSPFRAAPGSPVSPAPLPRKAQLYCLRSTQPSLLAGVDSIGRVESFFDAISYQKGGSIIRMIRAFLNNRRISQEQFGLRRSLLQVCCSGCLCVCVRPCDCACVCLCPAVLVIQSPPSTSLLCSLSPSLPPMLLPTSLPPLCLTLPLAFLSLFP